MVRRFAIVVYFHFSNTTLWKRHYHNQDSQLQNYLIMIENKNLSSSFLSEKHDRGELD